MKCPSCATRNRHDRRFCAQCGASLVHVCTQCGFSNGAVDLYCGGCGAELQQGAEIRSITSGPGSAAPDHAPAPRAGDHADMLSPEELGDLLKKPDSSAPGAIPVRVTQEDLDRLFGAKP